MVMFKMVVFISFVLLLSLTASADELIKQMYLEEGEKYQGSVSRIIENGFVVSFDIFCGDWQNDRKECHYVSKNGKSFIDSTIYKNGMENIFGQIKGLPKQDLSSKKSGYYDLVGVIYDENNERLYSFSRLSGYISDFEKYNAGRLVLKEKGCESINEFYQGHCLQMLQSLSNKRKGDFEGRYVYYQERFVWDGYGRIKQRTVRNLREPIDSIKVYNFSYGTPCDKIRVTPVDYVVDWDALSEKGKYDGSFGKMPEKDDPEYAEFAKNPYEFEATPELLERQKKRCEDYKKSLKKGNGKTR